MISALKIERGLALPDLLNGAFEFIDGLQLKPAARVYLLDILATIECVVHPLRSIVPYEQRFPPDIDWQLVQARRYNLRPCSALSRTPLRYHRDLETGR